MNKKSFGVFCNTIVGNVKKAENIFDCFKKFTQKENKFWSHVSYKDEEDNTITIYRHHLIEMMNDSNYDFDGAINFLIEDHKLFGDTLEEIHCWKNKEVITL